MPIVKASRYAYSDTLAHLTTAISGAGATLFAVIDQTAAAQSVGLSLRPTALLVFGNPRGGTPLMDEFPLAALALPLRLLVWEGDGGVHVAYTPMIEELAAYGVPAHDPRPAGLDRFLAALTDALA